MKYGNVFLLLFAGLVACRSDTAIPFVAERLTPATPAHLNIVLYLSSCTPCGSLTFDGAAAFVRTNPHSSHLYVVVNRNASRAAELFRERVSGVNDVTFVDDTDGSLARSAAVPSLPFLVIYDDSRRLLRAEAIAPSGSAHACLNEEITALYTIPLS
ncbi:MAG TPA: hypothetical protein VGR95_14485 [Thermoanaerobaculia bacterium]|jgi:hypothetical protein|nr:hypothetical protein [Thermoanaerobaculia bacterium]